MSAHVLAAAVALASIAALASSRCMAALTMEQKLVGSLGFSWYHSFWPSTGALNVP